MTQLEYMLDTYKFTSVARVVETWNNKFWNYIILDKTIFYPQWGWQPTDIGTIELWDKKVKVVHVRADEYGKVLHYIQWDIILDAGKRVDIKIDEPIRRFNARNHSAGHLLSEAIKNIWYGHIVSNKWFHFPKWAYVEYDWKIAEEKKIEFIQKLEAELKNIIDTDLPMMVEYQWLSEGEIPTKSIKRSARFQWLKWCGCGWTHVKSSAEIWGIKIRKIRNISWQMRISYDIFCSKDKK